MMTPEEALYRITKSWDRKKPEHTWDDVEVEVGGPSEEVKLIWDAIDRNREAFQEKERLESLVSALQRENDRLRTGMMVEGDYVMSDASRIPRNRHEAVSMGFQCLYGRTEEKGNATAPDPWGHLEKHGLKDGDGNLVGLYANESPSYMKSVIARGLGVPEELLSSEGHALHQFEEQMKVLHTRLQERLLREHKLRPDPSEQMIAAARNILFPGGDLEYPCGSEELGQLVNLFMPVFGPVVYCATKPKSVDGVSPRDLIPVGGDLPLEDIDTIGMRTKDERRRFVFGCIEEEVAKNYARSGGMLYGMSPFGHVINPNIRWYAGTREELQRVGVTEYKDPKEEEGA